MISLGFFRQDIDGWLGCANQEWGENRSYGLDSTSWLISLKLINCYHWARVASYTYSEVTNMLLLTVYFVSSLCLCQITQGNKKKRKEKPEPVQWL